MMKDYLTIPFYTDDGEKIELAVLEQTRINGINYLLVSAVEEENPDEDTEEAYAFILREKEPPSQEESEYEEIEDEEEILSVSRIFEQLMDDIDFEVE